MSIEVGITMDDSSTNLELLRSMSETSRDRFDRGLGVSALMGDVYNGLVPQMNAVIADAFTRIKEPHLVNAGSEEELTVVHYTKVEVVVNMLRDHALGISSCLRMYDTFHSNDPGEGKYLTHNLDEATNNRLEELLGKSAPCAYVASFVSPRCESQVNDVSDNLMFWRTYGFEGAGCSLTVKIPRNRLFRVKYGRGEAKTGAEQVKNLVDAMGVLKSKTLKSLDPVLDISSTETTIGVVQNHLRESLESALRGELDCLFYLYKSKGYEYEQEVRSIEVPTVKGGTSDEVRFDFSRPSDSGEIDVRHYYERDDLRVTNLLTTGSVITIGPCVQNRENVAYYLEHLKRKSNLLGPQVVQSQVSYRNS